MCVDPHFPFLSERRVGPLRDSHVVAADDVEPQHDLLDAGGRAVDALVTLVHDEVDRLVEPLQRPLQTRVKPPHSRLRIKPAQRVDTLRVPNSQGNADLGFIGFLSFWGRSIPVSLPLQQCTRPCRNVED